MKHYKVIHPFTADNGVTYYRTKKVSPEEYNRLSRDSRKRFFCVRSEEETSADDAVAPQPLYDDTFIEPMLDDYGDEEDYDDDEEEYYDEYEDDDDI